MVANLNRGFTYLGLLIVIAIIGIAASATTTLGALAQRKDAEEDLLIIGLTFQQAIKNYYHATPSGQGRYPRNLEDLIRDPRFPTQKRYIRRIYPDPITGKADWALIKAPDGGIMGIHSLSSQRPIKIGLFPIELSGFEGKEQYSEWCFTFSPQLKGIAYSPFNKCS